MVTSLSIIRFQRVSILPHPCLALLEMWEEVLEKAFGEGGGISAMQISQEATGFFFPGGPDPPKFMALRVQASVGGRVVRTLYYLYVGIL